MHDTYLKRRTHTNVIDTDLVLVTHPRPFAVHVALSLRLHAEITI